jgi:hypothetical protein
VVLGLLALTARGPMGLVRVCGPRLHLLLDVAAGVLLALSPLVRPWRPGAVGVVAIELVAVAWLRVTMLTRYPGRADHDAVTVGSPAVSEASSTFDDPVGGDATGRALTAIRGLGRMTASARSRIPDSQTTLASGARRMGSRAGRWQRAWRRAAR